MLPDRIVVETQVCGELGDVDGSARVGDVAEDLVPRGVAEGPRLFLQSVGHRRLSP